MRSDRIGALLVVLALAALAVLYVKSQVGGGDEANQIIDGARRLRELDAQLDSAVLESQNGLSIDYDALTSTVREMQATTRDVERRAANEPELRAPTAAMSARVAEKAALVEQFKSANSILRNSAAYLPLSARRASDPRREDRLSERAVVAISDLLASVLRCGFECSSATVAELDRNIAALSANLDLEKPQARATIGVLLRHAALISHTAPELERIVRSLVDAGSRPYEAVYAAARARREAAIERANVYRDVLVALSLALFAAIAIMITRLRRSGLELQALNNTLESRVESRTRELYKLEADLRAAQKLESIGRLASGVAHEINTPVQFVSDSVEFVRDSFLPLGAAMRSLTRLLDAPAAEIPARTRDARAACDAADAEYVLTEIPGALASSVEGLQRIATIVRALKEFSHPDETKKIAVDLNANVRSTLAVAANEYKHVADLVTELADLPPVVCHAGEINQVILNLIVNAAHSIGDVVKGSDRRGTITVQTWQEGPNVVVCVRDTGAGIPSDIHDKIFDPFFTTKDVGRGTGQGLAISRNVVVDKHRGDLTFETEPGRGTAFFVRLPVNGASKMRAAA